MSVFISSTAGAAAQFFDNSGNVLTGGKIYTYAAGTTSPVSTYTSSTGLYANTNPIILDSAGRVPEEIWFAENQTYKFVLTDADDVLLGTWDNLVSVNEIVDGSITTAKLADGAVTTIKIADANVTTSKIAALNITTALIADSNVTTAKIADLNVTTGKLNDNAVTTVKITDGNVTTAKIADANVTTIKIADANVTTDKIADAAITTAKLEKPYVVGTPVNLTGSSVTISGIPSWVTQINVFFTDMTTAAPTSVYMQSTAAGTYYVYTDETRATGTTLSQTSSILPIDNIADKTVTRFGNATLRRVTNSVTVNDWVYSCTTGSNYNPYPTSGAAGSLTVSIGQVSGTSFGGITIGSSSTFTGGTVNISYQ